MNKIFRSEIIVSADLHAGGYLFGVLFQKILKFHNDGLVIMEKQIIDEFNPIDKQDVVHLNAFKIQGTWYKSETNNIRCVFQNIFLEMNGVLSPSVKGRLIFHCYDSRLSRQWGEVYQEETETFN